MTPLAIDPVANILAGSNCCVLSSLLRHYALRARLPRERQRPGRQGVLNEVGRDSKT